MASTETFPASFDFSSYETALCIIPPESTWPPIERIRTLYDKSYRKWPPHVNLVYPFVRPESLVAAARKLQSGLQQQQGKLPIPSVDVCLESADVFHQRREKTLFRCDDRKEGSQKQLQSLRHEILSILGDNSKSSANENKKNDYTMHMTVAQSGGAPNQANVDVPSDTSGHAHKFLLHKVELMPPTTWTVDKLFVLVRERLVSKSENGEVTAASSRMLLWGILHLEDGRVERFTEPKTFYDRLPEQWNKTSIDEDKITLDTEEDVVSKDESKDEKADSFNAFGFDVATNQWTRNRTDSTANVAAHPSNLSIASYNVLAEFEWPPSNRRVPILVRNVLSAKSDVLVLQEVTDDFLSALLADKDIREAYPFVSHGPPDQIDVEPLPSLLNVVVLSRRPFTWSLLPFHRTHKGALIARFGSSDGDNDGLVLAAVHLTHGLTTGSVACKKVELTRLLSHLKQNFRKTDPVVIAGDFNIHTSSSAIAAALNRNNITPQAAQFVETGFDALCAKDGFVDTWASTRGGDAEDDEFYDEYGEDQDKPETYPGEEGATYDTLTNALAAQITGSGLNNRPQRFDRILLRHPAQTEDQVPNKVRKSGHYRIEYFSQFGFAAGDEDDTDPDSFGSDHFGIRCVLERVEGHSEDEDEDHDDDDSVVEEMAALDMDDEGDEEDEEEPEVVSYSDEIARLVVPVEPIKAPAGPLAEADSLNKALEQVDAIPSEDEVEKRKEAFALLKSIIVDEQAAAAAQRARLPRQLVMSPAGSYGLGVWTPESDIDCLCIGAMSASTFFALATQRLNKARTVDAEVKIIRRVHAHTGTMLELEVHGFHMDLQYCQAPLLAETWPAVLVLPQDHSALKLSMHELNKLKAVRDLYYLRKSFPERSDNTTTSICTASNFRLANRAIKTWAHSRGVYAARFGYLGGIQIAILLARVMRLMQRQLDEGRETNDETTDDDRSDRKYTVEDILVTFFHHYGTFDWQTKVAFDPFFHHEKLTYSKTSHEPMAILGFHRPHLNTATAASQPSVRVLASEFRNAGRLLAAGNLTWDEFLRGQDDTRLSRALRLPPGPASFVQAYRSYVKIDLQYWGLSLRRGASFVGWLESRCVLLLVDMARRLPELDARIWPGRFVEGDETLADEGDNDNDNDNDDGTGRQYQGFYLIGLDLPDTMSREARRMALVTLQPSLANFEKQIQRSADHYDPQWQWMAVSVANRDELGDLAQLRLDNRPWGLYTPGDEAAEEDEPEEEEDEEAEEDSEANDHSGSDEERKTSKPAKKKALSKKDRKEAAVAAAKARTGSHANSSSSKFRSAQDVIKRLRWDPHLDRNDYIVGYEDRFAGAQEKSLEAWKGEQTDEEFIPQHRILYFRRRSDGVVVWDRRSRKDDVFGSGH